MTPLRWISMITLCFGLCLLSPVHGVEAKPKNQKNFSSFTQFRHTLLNILGSAKTRILLNTDFLSDGEIVTALYLAQYRKVEVQVFLGRHRANHYLSRLKYLKRQRIPVYLTPQSFPKTSPTVLIVDQRAYGANSSLDYKSSRTYFTLQAYSKSTQKKLAKAFKTALKNPTPARAAPTPLVGRGHRQPRVMSRQTPRYRQSGSPDQSYNYDHRPQQRKAPKGMPKALPKETIFQMKQRVKEQGNLPPVPPP